MRTFHGQLSVGVDDQQLWRTRGWQQEVGPVNEATNTNRSSHSDPKIVSRHYTNNPNTGTKRGSTHEDVLRIGIHQKEHWPQHCRLWLILRLKSCTNRAHPINCWLAVLFRKTSGLWSLYTATGKELEPTCTSKYCHASCRERVKLGNNELFRGITNG